MGYQQALLEIQAGQFDAAIAHLTPLLQADPSQPKLWQAKSVALLSSNQIDAAIAAAEQAISLDRNLAAAHRLLGKARSQAGDKLGAIAAYKQATRCYLDSKDKANAQACLTQIEQLRMPQAPAAKPAPPVQPTQSTAATPPQSLISPEAFFQDAKAKLKKGRYGEALQDLNWLLQLDPNNPEALAQRGLAHARRSNYRAAVSDFAQAMKLSPDDPSLRLQRSEMRLLVGDARGAIADLTTLLANQATDPAQVYALRGQAHQKLKDFDNAFKDFSNALGIDPNNAACYQFRGQACETTDDLEDALSNYQQAASLHLNQGNWSAHQDLQYQIQALETKLQRQKDAAERVIRVPIQQLSGGTPVIEVLFNGCVPFNMVLDTGAGMTCLTQEMARLLNIIPTGTKRFRMADGWITEDPVGIVRSVSVDRAQVENLEVAISPHAPEGLLGQNYLWRYDIRILQSEVELHLR